MEELSKEIVKSINLGSNFTEPELLNAITKPLTNKIIQLDKAVLDRIAQNKTIPGDTLIKHVCKKTTIYYLNESGFNLSYTKIEKCNL